MKKFKDSITAGVGTLISAIGTSLQPNEVLEMISLIITIIGAVLTLVMSLYNWWKNAKKDDKITKEELNEGAKILADGVEKIKNLTEGGKKNADIKGSADKDSESNQ